MKERGLSNGELGVDKLTWREQEILTLLAERLTNREIGAGLHLAESTVKDYVGNILSKLYVKNRREAVERAKALGLLESDRKTVSRPKTNLPAEPTQFVGRRKELEEIKLHLGETRLLTLTGPGGIGKTRLALKAAGGVVQDFKDGAFLVALAPIYSPEYIIQTIAEALKFPLATQEDPQVQLLRYLRRRQLLLVIDNFEHLLDGAGIVSEIIQSAPDVIILATSRERLNLRGETILNVGGLAYPYLLDSRDIFDYDAITLFLQRARKVRPGFEPTPGELEQITNICQMVGGMPIAIELAAAWLQILNLDEIAGELQKGFDILTTEMRDAPERHRSIRAIFDHSWSLLNPTEGQIFTRLSVFRGGFTREAAQQVSGASLQLLVGLVNKSFLSHDPGSGRLEMHELLRQYAVEKLGTKPRASYSVREAHAAYFAGFTQGIWRDIRGKGQMLAIAEIEADIENVRAAWRYYLTQKDISQLWKFIKCLWYLYWIRWWNHAGMELFAEALKMLGDPENEEHQALRALAMAFQGYYMPWLDLADQGYELTIEAVAILKGLDHPKSLALAYDCLAINAFFLKRYEVEIESTKEMLKVATGLDDKWLLAFSYFTTSMAELIQENFGQARQLAETNLELCEEIGDVIGSTQPLIVLGHAAFARGEYQAARGYYLRCLEISGEAGFHYSIQTASKYMCKVALSLSNIAESKKYLLQSLTITREIGFIRDIVNLLYEFARLRVAQGNFEGAAELLALVIDHPASDLYRMLEGRIRDSARELLSKIKHDLPAEVFNAALERGRNLDLDGLIDDILAPHV